MQRAQQLKNAPMSVWGFLSVQILFQHPLAAPLWTGGIVALFFQKTFRTYRLFGISYVLLFALFVLQRGKPYYLSPLYPIILAAGAVAFEQYIVRNNRLWIFRTYGILLAIAGLTTMPLFLSLTPPRTFISITSSLGINDVQMERTKSPALPQVLADRFGWRELTHDVSTVFHFLTPRNNRRLQSSHRTTVKPEQSISSGSSMDYPRQYRGIIATGTGDRVGTQEGFSSSSEAEKKITRRCLNQSSSRWCTQASMQCCSRRTCRFTSAGGSKRRLRTSGQR